MDIRRMFTYDHNSQSDSGAKLCDVAYWDGSSVKTIDIDNWNISLGTPIGVVVIPSGLLPDGKARIVSLKAVNSSGDATASYYLMDWGEYSDTELPDYTYVPIMNTNQIVSGSSTNGYLPSDNFTMSQSVADPKTSYGVTYVQKIPSPYFNTKLNPDYCMELDRGNVLSDFNGLSNTKTAVERPGACGATVAAYKYNDGINAVQWYLPAAGELGFCIARLKAINNIISVLGGVTIRSVSFWSSSEKSRSAWRISFKNGNILCSNKNVTNTNYVRPFAILS